MYCYDGKGETHSSYQCPTLFHIYCFSWQIQLTSFGQTGTSSAACKGIVSNGNGVAENGTAGDIRNSRQQNGAGDADVMRPAAKKRKTRLPVDLELEYVLGDMPQKVGVQSIDIHVYGSVGFTCFH